MMFFLWLESTAYRATVQFVIRYLKHLMKTTDLKILGLKYYF